MKNIVDNFSQQSLQYKKYRPEYPHQIFKEIFKYVNKFDYCLDCGTGNGQTAFHLSNFFKRVCAVDISLNQLRIAKKSENINYFAARSELTPFRDSLFDLITASQAVHWFDITRFRQEVFRLLMNNGVIALIGYGLVNIDSETDKLIEDFYSNTMGEYWDEERKYLEDEYDGIDLELDLIIRKKYFFIEAAWSSQDLLGYLNSWSSVQKYIKEKGFNPVSKFENEIHLFWQKNIFKNVKFPLFLKLYRVNK